jgi:hypothetical protein
MVWKKKTNIFHDQMEQKLAERRLKRLKKFMLVAGISLAVGIVGLIVHNALYGLYEKEELVSFFITLVALWVFNIATIGSLYIFLKGAACIYFSKDDDKQHKGNTEISSVIGLGP